MEDDLRGVHLKVYVVESGGQLVVHLMGNDHLSVHVVEEDYLMESRDQLVEDHHPSVRVVEADHQCVLVVGSRDQLVGDHRPSVHVVEADH